MESAGRAAVLLWRSGALAAAPGFAAAPSF
jgi:hypothetical protein